MDQDGMPSTWLDNDANKLGQGGEGLTRAHLGVLYHKSNNAGLCGLSFVPPQSTPPKPYIQGKEKPAHQHILNDL